jgi:hypothetical protein
VTPPGCAAETRRSSAPQLWSRRHTRFRQAITAAPNTLDAASLFQVPKVGIEIAVRILTEAASQHADLPRPRLGPRKVEQNPRMCSVTLEHVTATCRSVIVISAPRENFYGHHNSDFLPFLLS